MNNSNTASLWLRALAFVIDYIILAIIYMEGSKNSLSLWNSIPVMINLSIWIIYFILLQSWFSGTIGKRLCGIKLVSNSGMQRPTYLQCLKRTVVRYFSMFAFMYGYFSMFLNNTPQTWHDEVADTLVVNS